MKGLDRPLLADIAGQVGGACPPGFRTRDAERGDGRDRLAAQAGDVPLDEEHLADVREREVVGSGQDLDGPGGDPAVALIGGGMSDRDLVPRQCVEGIEQGRRFSFTGSTNSPPRSWMWSAVAFTVCSASAVTILPSRSIWSSTRVAIGTSFVFLPTSACAATTEAAASGPTRAASSRTWFPSASFAPRIALPSSLTCISALRPGARSSAPPATGAANPAAFISQAPTAASNISGSAPVSTRQIVVFDGAPAGMAPARRYRSARIAADTSATHPVMAA